MRCDRRAAVTGRSDRRLLLPRTFDSRRGDDDGDDGDGRVGDDVEQCAAHRLRRAGARGAARLAGRRALCATVGAGTVATASAEATRFLYEWLRVLRGHAYEGSPGGRRARAAALCGGGLARDAVLHAARADRA